MRAFWARCGLTAKRELYQGNEIIEGPPFREAYARGGNARLSYALPHNEAYCLLRQGGERGKTGETLREKKLLAL